MISKESKLEKEIIKKEFNKLDIKEKLVFIKSHILFIDELIELTNINNKKFWKENFSFKFLKLKTNSTEDLPEDYE